MKLLLLKKLRGSKNGLSRAARKQAALDFVDKVFETKGTKYPDSAYKLLLGDTFSVLKVAGWDPANDYIEGQDDGSHIAVVSKFRLSDLKEALLEKSALADDSDFELRISGTASDRMGNNMYSRYVTETVDTAPDGFERFTGYWIGDTAYITLVYSDHSVSLFNAIAYE